jgi:hypothetical protein
VTAIVIIGGMPFEYERHDFIKESNERLDAIEADPEKYEGVPRPERRLSADTDVYPKSPSYTFQEFAGPVFELGGYGDLTLINPTTLERLWVADVLKGEASIYDAMTNVIAVAEEIGFLDD